MKESEFDPAISEEFKELTQPAFRGDVVEQMNEKVIEPARKIKREDRSEYVNPVAGLRLEDPNQIIDAIRIINQLPYRTRGDFRFHSVGTSAFVISVEDIDEALTVLNEHNIHCHEVPVVRVSDLPPDEQIKYRSRLPK